jgi:NADP-dependent 3-hydroxy acid dehydrogenase YdfG
MVAHAVAVHGRLDALVLNAGVRSDLDPTQPLDVAAYRHVCGVNLDAVVFGVDAGVPALAATNGSILVAASLAGLDPTPANPVYAMGKAGAVAYVRAMVPATLRPDGSVARLRSFLS